MTDDPRNFFVCHRIAKRSPAQDVSPREAALCSQAVTAVQYDAWVDPAEMMHPRYVQ